MQTELYPEGCDVRFRRRFKDEKNIQHPFPISHGTSMVIINIKALVSQSMVALTASVGLDWKILWDIVLLTNNNPLVTAAFYPRGRGALKTFRYRDVEADKKPKNIFQKITATQDIGIFFKKYFHDNSFST